MFVADLISMAAETLQDEQHTTYTQAQLMQGINQACLTIALVKPESCSELMICRLRAGRIQTLPDEALRLLDAMYRLDASHQPEAPIVLVDQKDFEFLPGAEGPVANVAYNEKLANAFFVDPPAIDGDALLLLCSKIPVLVIQPDDPFPLSAKYSQPALEYLLYLMFRRDSERTPNAQRAQAHRQAFFDLLQLKSAGDATVSAEAKRISGL